MFWLLPRVRVRPSCIPTACKYPTLRGSSGRDLLARYSTPPPGSIRRSPTFGTVSGILTVILGGTAGYLLASQFSSAGNSLPNVRRTGSYGSEADMQSAILELEAALPGQVSTNPGVLQHHAFSPNTYHHGSAHRVVVSIAETPDVVTVVNISRRWRIPITPYSGGTSLEGNFEGVGGICLDMSPMNRILQINEADGDLICQAGTRWEDINDTLKEKGIPLFFPLDPGPGATIGGMMGTGCSGTNAVRYGTAKGEWFLNATVVLPSGEVIKTRQRARKSSAGFDTTKLFIGAEGTLGIVTEVTIRLAPRLPTSVAVVQFPDVQKATTAVAEILNLGGSIQCVELLDDQMMRAVNLSGLSSHTYPEKDSLFFKFQGSDETIRETTRLVQKVVKKHGGTGFKAANSAEEAETLWENRKMGLWSTMALVEGAKCWTTDVCVPVSRLPELVYETKKDIAQSGITSTILGHVGDGNFHALLLFRDDEELAKVRDLVHRMVHRAIALDGTGEHGVGMGKKEYLYEELGRGTVELMKTVKRALDPLNLFNPGKLYPDDETK